MLLVGVVEGWVLMTSPRPMPPRSPSRRRALRWRSNLTAANAGAAPFADHDDGGGGSGYRLFYCAANTHLPTPAQSVLFPYTSWCYRYALPMQLHHAFVHSFTALLYLALAAVYQSCISH